MGTRNFNHLNWEFILACYKRSGITKKQFFTQKLPLLYPNVSLPKLSTFYSYLREQEAKSCTPKAAKQSEVNTTQPTKLCMRLVAKVVRATPVTYLPPKTLKPLKASMAPQPPPRRSWLYQLT